MRCITNQWGKKTDFKRYLNINQDLKIGEVVLNLPYIVLLVLIYDANYSNYTQLLKLISTLVLLK